MEMRRESSRSETSGRIMCNAGWKECNWVDNPYWEILIIIILEVLQIYKMDKSIEQHYCDIRVYLLICLSSFFFIL